MEVSVVEVLHAPYETGRAGFGACKKVVSVRPGY
jgi:hypothetical protein